MTLHRTLLTPRDKWQSTSKTFSAPKEKSNDYNLGKFFHYEQVTYSSLEEFAFDLRSRNNSIAIYGTPTNVAEMDILTDGYTVRRTTRFEYPTDQTLHIFDIDGWVIQENTREVTGAVLTEPDMMAALINQMLRNEGFDILADASKVIVLTSSQWDLQHLNCHLYFHFSEPIMVDAMREFATALAKTNQRTIFDPAIFKAVQPDFIAPPVCMNFKDPLKGKRIFYSKGTQEIIPTEDFQALINTTLEQADWNPQSKNSSLPTISTSWLKTIQDCVGDERGINEPSFRAAAQLVQEMGRSNVLANIDSYSEQMFDAVWNTLTINGSDRGESAKDKQTYDRPRFRQYLQSATEKNFGDRVDTMVTQVNDAIEKAKTGDMTNITSSPVISSLCTLRSKHPSQFTALKTAIKMSKTLSLGDLNYLMKSRATDTLAKDGSEVLFTADDGPQAENRLMDTVLAQYEMICDAFGNRYAQVPGNGDGGYRMMRVDGALVNVFYVDGLRMSGDQVGPHFGKKTIAKLLGEESRAITSGFQEALIGTRIVSEDMAPGAPTWINLGLQTDGIFRVAKLDADGVTIMKHQDTSVRWMHNTPPLYIATNEEIEERFGVDADLMEYLITTLHKFIATDDNDMIKLLMWLSSVFSDKTLSYIAELTGIAASGKSTAADFLKDLVDPSNGVLGMGADRTLFSNKSEQNFVADIEQRHVTILDNVSKLTTNSQDMLCSIATGLRQSERILYTQEQMERTVRRPLIITALSPVITRPDLRSRVVSVSITEAEFNRDFLKDWSKEKPYLVAAIMQLTSKAMDLHRNITSKPARVGTRDIFLACVSSAIAGKDEIDYTYVLEERLFDAMNMSEDVGFVRLMIRWMDEEFKHTDTAEFATRGLVTKLRRWVGANVGLQLDGIDVNFDMVPETGSGLGWQLAKYTDTISKVSDWNFETKVRKSNGYSFIWRRKNTEHNSLEELL